MGEAKGGGTRWAVQKPISILRQRLLIVLHAPPPATGAKLISELLFPKLRLGRFQIQTRPLGGRTGQYPAPLGSGLARIGGLIVSTLTH